MSSRTARRDRPAITSTSGYRPIGDSSLRRRQISSSGMPRSRCDASLAGCPSQVTSVPCLFLQDASGHRTFATLRCLAAAIEGCPDRTPAYPPCRSARPSAEPRFSVPPLPSPGKRCHWPRKPPRRFPKNPGAGEGIRTLDPNLGNVRRRFTPQHLFLSHGPLNPFAIRVFLAGYRPAPILLLLSDFRSGASPLLPRPPPANPGKQIGNKQRTHEQE